MIKKKLKCLIIGPFGKTPEEQKSRKSLEIIINGALEKDFDVTAFHAAHKAVMDADIFTALVEADLVVADLRSMNPNVMYELGIRHAFNRPVIQMVDSETALPWDIDKNYAIKYENPIQVADMTELVNQIFDRANKVLKMDSNKDSFSSFASHVTSRATINNLAESHGDLKSVLFSIQNAINGLNGKVSKMEKDRALRSSFGYVDGNYGTILGTVLPTNPLMDHHLKRGDLELDNSLIYTSTLDEENSEEES